MKTGPIHVVAAAAIIPAIALCALMLPEVSTFIPALGASRLPSSMAYLALTLCPLISCLFFDRDEQPSIATALIISLAISSVATTAMAVCASLYPPDIDLGLAITSTIACTLATTGLSLGVRATGRKPGIATSVVIGLYMLPPLFFYLSAEIANTPSMLFHSASPAWAYVQSHIPWGYVALGALGLVVTFFCTRRVRQGEAQ